MPPTPDEIVRQWFKEVWDEGREDAIDRLLAPDALVHGLSGPDGRPIRGPLAFKPFFQMMQRALGDVEIRIERTIVEEDMCAAHCHVTARHVGPTLGGRPSNTPVQFWGMCMARVHDGRIAEGWNCFDFLSMYQQLGWVKNPPLP